MAETNGKASAPRSVSISSNKVKKFATDIGAAAQKLSNATMSHAELWQKFENEGGNRAALKHCLKLKKQDVAKSADYQHHSQFYSTVLGLDDQMKLFDERTADEQNRAEVEAHNEGQPIPQ